MSKCLKVLKIIALINNTPERVWGKFMEQAVLKALTQAMSCQNDLQLASSTSEQSIQSGMQLVNADQGKQSQNIVKNAKTMETISDVMTWVSLGIGIASIMTIGLCAAPIATASELAVTTGESVVGTLGAFGSVANGGLTIAKGVVEKNEMDINAQAGVDNATGQILGSIAKTAVNSVKDSANANATIAQKTTEAVQAYGRAQRGQ